MRKDEPIIQSLTDVDFYKPNMMQLYFNLHRDVPAKFGFTNRSKDVSLGGLLDMGQLYEELAHVRTLRHSSAEIKYYTEQGLYSAPFLDFLSGLTLPAINTEVGAADKLTIETDVAPLPEVTLWETLTLSIVNELYYRHVMKGQGLDNSAGRARIEREGERRLLDKLSVLRTAVQAPVIEFGTRRRFSRAWQRHVVEIVKNEIPDLLLGTSNVALAHEFGLEPKGTMAHELFMAYACIHGGTDEGLRGSHYKVLEDWECLYGPKLLVALTDTFGSDFFFRDFDPALTGRWSGLRHDSGDSIVFGERAIAHYRHLGINPHEKALVFSDGLNIGEIHRIEQAMRGKIRTSYGWGTDLTNDVGFRSLSLVMKLVMASWRYAVKLSDNPAKHMGPKDEVARAQRVFGYRSGDYVPLHS